jgi:hypothetical protein
VQENKHRAFHLLFGTMTPDEIALELSQKWIPADWKIVAFKNS